MFVSGFTIVRNARRLDYPFVESLRSLLPLVDELIVGVGDSDDGTWEAVAAISESRIKPFHSPWGAPTAAGEVLSQQTNLALSRCQGDWAMYLQADEVLHEDDVPVVRAAMTAHLDSPVEGLLFRYHHFWKHYSIEADCWQSFYRHAVRAIRLGRQVESIGDAAGFARRIDGRTRGLIKAHSGARIFHYGWCNTASNQLARVQNLRTWYNADAPINLSVDQMFWEVPVKRFTATHPSTMADRIAAAEPLSGVSLRRHWPAWMRAGASAIASPVAAKAWARPLFPIVLTNAWWKWSDWRGHRGNR